MRRAASEPTEPTWALGSVARLTAKSLTPPAGVEHVATLEQQVGPLALRAPRS